MCLDDGIVGRLSNERCRVVWKKYEPDGQCVWQVDQFKGKELSDQMRLGGTLKHWAADSARRDVRNLAEDPISDRATKGSCSDISLMPVKESRRDLLVFPRQAMSEPW